MAMKHDFPYLDAPQRCDLLRRITAPYADVDPDIIIIVSLIKSISRSFSAQMALGLASHELTEGKFYVLAYLLSEEIAGHPNPSPSEIASHLDVTRGTITGLLDGLERDGYLERCVDQTDRRALSIQITPKAREFLSTFLPASGVSLTNSICLTDAEKQILAQTLGRIETCLRKRDAVEKE